MLIENEFTEVMSKKDPEELIRILTVDKLNYSPLALQAAGSELEKHELQQSYIEEIKQKLQGQSYKDLKQESELTLQQYAKDLYGEHKKNYAIRHIFTMGGLDKFTIDRVLWMIELDGLHLKKEKAKKDMIYGACGWEEECS